MAECKSCGAPIRWAWTDKDKRMPLDAEPSEKGNMEIIGYGTKDGTTEPIVRVLKKGEGDTLPGLEPPPRYISHFATCPDAAQHRQAA
jgi:hypothetical protein